MAEHDQQIGIVCLNRYFGDTRSSPRALAGVVVHQRSSKVILSTRVRLCSRTLVTRVGSVIQSTAVSIGPLFNNRVSQYALTNHLFDVVINWLNSSIQSQ